jgi:predicted nucleic acid-binding protein
VLAAHGLVDTGALVALLDRRDDWHKACAAAYKKMRLPLATSEAVLTELFHLLGNSRREVQAAWRFVRSGAITVATLSDNDFAALDKLMARYHDRPMDFADATLVHLADREKISLVFTIDHDDFETYRTESGKHLRIEPAR